MFFGFQPNFIDLLFVLLLKFQITILGYLLKYIDLVIQIIYLKIVNTK